MKTINYTPAQWETAKSNKEGTESDAKYVEYCDLIIDAINAAESQVWLPDKFNYFKAAHTHFLGLGFLLSHNRQVFDGLLLVTIKKA